MTVLDMATAFDPASLVGETRTVPCTLSGGTQTQCLSVTITPKPASFEIGPWCPRNISDGPDMSGIWLDDGKVYDADGTFIQNLSAFYGDTGWQLFDPDTGRINVTDTQTSCEAAARPDVDPRYRNHCVECSVDYLPAGASQTFVIPLQPAPARQVGDRISRSGVGVAFSGVRLDAPAPVDAILSAKTLAPFDDCGGHVNTNVGYHLHAVTDCLTVVRVAGGHAGRIGLALDGYPIHARLDSAGTAAAGLDACSGHDAVGLGYHYHANPPGANAIIGCHVGETGCALDAPDAVCNAANTGRRGPPRDPR